MTHAVEVVERFWAKVRTAGTDDCWEWGGYRNRHGYGQCAVPTPGGGQRRLGAHRFVAECEVGRRLARAEHVMHSCDNPPCVNPAHLSLGDARRNRADCVAKGRATGGSLPGESHPLAVFTESAVHDIRQRYGAGGITQQALADEYGVSRPAVAAIVRRERWAHV